MKFQGSRCCGAMFAAVLVALMASAACADFVTWDSSYHSGDIPYTDSSSPSTHVTADYLSAWNAIAGNPPTAGYGDSGFNDWTNENNQTAVSSGANGSYGLHASFSFLVSPSDTGVWTFNLGNDADYGGVALMDGTEFAINPSSYWPNGPSGTVNLTAGVHTLDLYSFEGCCDGPGSSTFLDPLHAGGSPLAVNNVNLTPAPEPSSMALLGLGTVGIGAVAYRRRLRRSVG